MNPTPKERTMDFAPFIPAEKKEGYIGFYPCTKDEWYNLPLPLNSGWKREDVKGIEVDVFISNISTFVRSVMTVADFIRTMFVQGTDVRSNNIKVHIKDYKVGCYANLTWCTMTGAIALHSFGGEELVKQGGYKGFMPKQVTKDENDNWIVKKDYQKDKTFVWEPHVYGEISLVWR